MSNWQILGWTQVGVGAVLVVAGSIMDQWLVLTTGIVGLIIGAGNVWIWRTPR